MPLVAPAVLFRVAGGPRLGFGHIVRALSLARAMGVPPRLSIRGTRETRAAAIRLGALLGARRTGDDEPATRHRAGGEPGEASLHADLASDLDLMVIDDPHPGAAAHALAMGRRRGLPVASVHDLGLAPIASDLAIDGSLAMRRTRWPARKALLGSRYAVLDPALLTLAVRHPRTTHDHGSRRWTSRVDRHTGRGRAARPDSTRPRETSSDAARGAAGTARRRDVLVSLGGGRRIAVGLQAARAIAEAHPQAHVTLAAGFLAAPLSTGHPRVRLLSSPAALRATLARADVAVLAGGVTLYEAAALGVPAVAVAVVPAQMPTMRAFDRRGAAIGTGLLNEDAPGRASRTVARVVRAVGAALEDDARRARLARDGRRAVDGRGARRVAAALRALIRERRYGPGRK